MTVERMTVKECRAALTRAGLVRLACAKDNQPYVTPVLFAYDEQYLYGFTTPDQKIEWMRANPLVCVEVDEARGYDEWLSVNVCGRYEELPDAPEWAAARRRAHECLAKHAMWWQPPFVADAPGDGALPYAPVFYRISIERVTGYRAQPAPDEAQAASARELPARKLNALKLAARRVGGALKVLFTASHHRSPA